MVRGNEEVVVASAKTMVNRTSLSEVGEMGRYARGVWIMRLGKDDLITSVSTLAPSSTQDPARMAGPGPASNGTGPVEAITASAGEGSPGEEAAEEGEEPQE